MSSIPNFINDALKFLTLVSHIGLGIFILMWIFAKKTELMRKKMAFIAKHGLTLAWTIALIATGSSLFYSNIMHFNPCNLCWWQRIFMYPQTVLLGLAVYRKDKKIIPYVLPLLVIGAVIALYHVYLQFGGNPLIPCSATGANPCAFRPVFAYGYISIPTMSLTAFLLMIGFLKLSRKD